MTQLRLGYMNNVALIGRLVADPELRYTQKGAPVCDFRIACSQRFKNRESGEWQEDTLFINIVAWRRQAEIANDYLKKGSAVLIEGKLRSRQWETTNGEKRSAIEVVARRIQFLDAVQRDAESGGGEAVDEGETDTKHTDDIETPF
ncbi:single-stranded DNA-binding protein [candidate division WOR-3 bacterium]|nr:single-stranded DNA-binding protein [candidate division WOR-3 bacterium]